MTNNTSSFEFVGSSFAETVLECLGITTLTWEQILFAQDEAVFELPGSRSLLVEQENGFLDITIFPSDLEGEERFSHPYSWGFSLTVISREVYKIDVWENTGDDRTSRLRLLCEALRFSGGRIVPR